MNTKPFHLRALSDVFGNITDDLQHIFRAEVELARAEMEGRLIRSAQASLLLLVGVGVAGGAICLLITGCILLLAHAVPIWTATLIAAGVLTAASVALVLAGRARWHRKTVTSYKLMDSVKRDIRILRDRAL